MNYDYPKSYEVLHKTWPTLLAKDLLTLLEIAPVNRQELAKEYGIKHVTRAVHELRKTHEVLSIGLGRGFVEYQLLWKK